MIKIWYNDHFGIMIIWYYDHFGIIIKIQSLLNSQWSNFSARRS